MIIVSRLNQMNKSFDPNDQIKSFGQNDHSKSFDSNDFKLFDPNHQIKSFDSNDQSKSFDQTESIFLFHSDCGWIEYFSVEYVTDCCCWEKRSSRPVFLESKIHESKRATREGFPGNKD